MRYVREFTAEADAERLRLKNEWAMQDNRNSFVTTGGKWSLMLAAT
jgi:hypothetical protein